MNLQPGSQLQGGRYTIGKVLGQGGFGITYLGEQTALGRKVAIKEFFIKEHCDRADGNSFVSIGTVGSRGLVEKFREKFVKEARNIAKLKHVNIVSIIDIFEENNTAYYVMDYLEGGSLSDLINREGALDEATAVRYISQVASALDHLHSKKMMHLDVKPANILIDNEGNAVLIDFGLSKQYDSEGMQTSTSLTGLSHGYSPLEQYRDGGAGTFSPATDIYSLGATLYKAITGKTPPEAVDLINADLPALPANISSSVKNAIEVSMRSRRIDRPQNITEFLALLNGSSSAAAAGMAAAGAVAGGIAMPSQSDKTEIIAPNSDKTEIATPYSDKTEIATPYSDKTEIATPYSDKTEIATPNSDKTEIATPFSDKTEIATPFSDKTEIATSYSDKAEILTPQSDKTEILGCGGDRTVIAAAAHAKGEKPGQQQPVRQQPAAPVTPAAPQNEPKKRSGSSKWLVILLLLLLFAVGGAAVYFFLLSKDSIAGNDKERTERVDDDDRNRRRNRRYTNYEEAEEPVVETLETDSLGGEQAETPELPAVDEPVAQVTENRQPAAPAAPAASAPRPVPVAPAPQPETAAQQPSPASSNSYEANYNAGISASQSVDLGLPSGIKWAGYNVGASSPSGAGYYYSWGEVIIKSDYIAESYQYNGVDLGSSISGTGYDVALQQWGGNWRIPTKEDFDELVYRCKFEWTTYNGVGGYRVIGPNGKSIFFPAAGYYSGQGTLEAGDVVRFWTGTRHRERAGYAYYLKIAGRAGIYYGSKEFGMPVRPVRH